MFLRSWLQGQASWRQYNPRSNSCGGRLRTASVSSKYSFGFPMRRLPAHTRSVHSSPVHRHRAPLPSPRQSRPIWLRVRESRDRRQQATADLATAPVLNSVGSSGSRHSSFGWLQGVGPHLMREAFSLSVIDAPAYQRLRFNHGPSGDQSKKLHPAPGASRRPEDAAGNALRCALTTTNRDCLLPR